MNRIFLDTNIVADLIDQTRKNHQESLKLIEHLIINDFTICISEDMLSTLYYISKDKQSVLNFFQNVILIDWKILNYGQEVIQEAIKISKEKNYDLEDLLQCICAKQNQCKAIITNDKKFHNCGIQIITSENFLELY